MADPAFVYGVDDLGAVLGADSPAPDAPAGADVLDPYTSESAYRRAVLTILAEIRDLLATGSEG